MLTRQGFAQCVRCFGQQRIGGLQLPPTHSRTYPARRAGVGIANITQVVATTMRISFTRDLAPIDFTLPTGARAVAHLLPQQATDLDRLAAAVFCEK